MVKSPVWGYVRITTGTILGGTVGFYVVYRLEISLKFRVPILNIPNSLSYIFAAIIVVHWLWCSNITYIPEKRNEKNHEEEPNKKKHKSNELQETFCSALLQSAKRFLPGPKGTDNCADKHSSGPSSFESSEMAVCKTSILKSGAISEGYNFASTWEQNAPLTKQQQAAIVALSRAVGLEHTCGQDIGLSISRKHSTSEECGATETIMASRRDKNQFYKWFTDLEAATKSETEQKYQQYVIALTERLQSCDGILQQVDETIELLNQLQLQHQAVARKTTIFCDACDQLLMEKQRLIEFLESPRSKLKYVEKSENVTVTKSINWLDNLFMGFRSLR